MESLGGRSLSNPVEQTWQALREAVLAHPRVSGAKFDHDTKRVDLMTEKTVVPSRRRISAFVVVDTLGTRVVISGAGKRGPAHQVATELLAEVNHRLAAVAPPFEDAMLPPPAPVDKLPEPTLGDHPKPPLPRSDRTPRTPPKPPPPPAASPSPPKRPPKPTHDALSELADAND